MAKTKVLILHTSVGYGIKLTALNIAEVLKKSEEFEPRVEDIQKVESGAFAKAIEKVYRALTDRIPGLWGYLYRSRPVLFVMMPLRKFIASFKSKNTLNLLRQYQPAIVLSTQAVSTGIMAYLKSKGLYRGKLVAVFSDYHLHPFWCFPEVDLYFCNIAEQAAILMRMGVPKEKIAITGLFVSEKFYHNVDRIEACQQMGLLTTMPKVFLFSGGRPRMNNVEIFLQLMRSPKSFQIVAVCGKNEELKAELEKISAPSIHPTKIYGYSDQIDIIMSASDVMVGKTGGPSMGEAVLKKLPIVLTDIQPGHEEENLRFLLRNDVVVYGRIPREVVFLVEEFLDGKKRINWEHANETIIKPRGTVGVVEALIAIKPQALVRNYQEAG
jgi:processive 1,2-diacylglycerol beta-glucosyltransferase